VALLNQQRRHDRIHRSGQSQARRLSLHHRIGSDHSGSALTTLQSRSNKGCSGNYRGYGPTLWAHQRCRRLSRCPKGQIRRPALAGSQHATRRPMPQSILQTILEENPDSESQGSMETVAETTNEQLPFPPFRGGAIFNISVDSPHGKGKSRRTAPPASTGTSTMRNTSKRGYPCDG